MVQLAIRCLPRVPVATEELERWLETELEELRVRAPEGTIRLSRLTQELSSVEVSIGWLIELELPEDQSVLDREPLGPRLSHLRLLGLQPTLLVPGQASVLPGARATSVA
jgi:hypothetical protein